MSKNFFLERLSKLLYIEIKKEAILNVFKTNIGENLYLPVRAKRIIGDVSDSKNSDNISVAYFVEGMFYVLGGDPEFKYNSIYINILNNNIEGKIIVKKYIAEEYKNGFLEDAYILLKGLVRLEPERENYEKLIHVIDELRIKNSDFKEDEYLVLEEAKKISDFSTPYLFEGILKKQDGDFDGALKCLNNYISMGGKTDNNILEIISELKLYRDYENGIELVDTEPTKALSLLIPLVDKLDENPSVYFYVAVAYRKLENYEKAVYYLKEALGIDSNMVEVINELGINFASLGDFQTAVQYFRKAFEVTRSLEICTNLIMCYINLGDIEQAKLHLQIGQKLDKDDEILKNIESILKDKI